MWHHQSYRHEDPLLLCFQLGLKSSLLDQSLPVHMCKLSRITNSTIQLIKRTRKRERKLTIIRFRGNTGKIWLREKVSEKIRAMFLRLGQSKKELKCNRMKIFKRKQRRNRMYLDGNIITYTTLESPTKKEPVL